MYNNCDLTIQLKYFIFNLLHPQNGVLTFYNYNFILLGCQNNYQRFLFVEVYTIIVIDDKRSSQTVLQNFCKIQLNNSLVFINT